MLLVHGPRQDSISRLRRRRDVGKEVLGDVELPVVDLLGETGDAKRWKGRWG